MSSPIAISTTDQQLAVEAKRGCRRAFAELAKRFQPRLVNYLNHRCGALELAEDATQETLLAAFQAIHRFDPKWQVSTWLFTIARRKAGKLSQRQRETTGFAELNEALTTAQAAEKAAHDNESHCAIWQVARNVLCQEQFTALWMYYVEGLDGKQTARVLGKSFAAARAVLARARHAMRPHLLEWREDSTRSRRQPADYQFTGKSASASMRSAA